MWWRLDIPPVRPTVVHRPRSVYHADRQNWLFQDICILQYEYDTISCTCSHFVHVQPDGTMGATTLEFSVKDKDDVTTPPLRSAQ